MNFEKLMDQRNEKELESMRRLQKAEVTINSLKSAYQQLTSMIFEIKN